jgi:hypothetical protein
MRSVTAALLLFIGPFGAAQTIVRGSIHDRGGAPVPNATVEILRADGPAVSRQAAASDGRFVFNALPAGEYHLRASASDFYPATYEFLLRQREVTEMEVLLDKQQRVSEQVKVQEKYLTVDPEKTGSSYTFTHADLERLPDPLTDSTNDLVNNLMPGGERQPRQLSRCSGNRVLVARVCQRSLVSRQHPAPVFTRNQPADF